MISSDDKYCYVSIYTKQIGNAGSRNTEQRYLRFLIDDKAFKEYYDPMSNDQYKLSKGRHVVKLSFDGAPSYSASMSFIYSGEAAIEIQYKFKHSLFCARWVLVAVVSTTD